MTSLPGEGEQYGRYRIVKVIGRGGMGVVYEAVDTMLRRVVALKVVLPGLSLEEDFRLRFEREAALLAKIRSRNVVTILDYGQVDDTAYIATEFFADGDLHRYLEEHGPIPPRQSLELIGQVCGALSDAHAAGVLHRDVKPGNVLLWKRPEGLVPYLCDFGIATDGDASMTRTGTLVGSLTYMAPERHLGQAATEKTDQYSAACVLWACLSGTAPYVGTDFQIANAHLHEPIPQLPEDVAGSAEINALLARAMAKDPDDRFATMDDFGQAVAAVAASLVEPDTAGAPASHGAAPVAAVVSDEPTMIKAMPAEAAKVPPAPPAGEHAAERTDSRRRALVIGASVLGVLAVAGVATAVLAGGVGDSPGAVTTPSATFSASATPSTPLLAAPLVHAVGGYHRVTFQVSGLAAGTQAYASTDGGRTWKPVSGTTTALSVKRPGAKVCVQERAEDGTGATSPSVSACGNSWTPAIGPLRADPKAACPAGTTGYRFQLSGLEPGSRVTPTGQVPGTGQIPFPRSATIDRHGTGSTYLCTGSSLRITIRVPGASRTQQIG